MSDIILEVRDLVKHYPLRRFFFFFVRESGKGQGSKWCLFLHS